MAPERRTGGMLVVVMGILILPCAGASLGIVTSISDPPTGTWFPTSATTVSGNATGPAVDASAIDKNTGLSNGTFDGVAIQGSSGLQLIELNTTNWRYFDSFDYPLGTNSSSMGPAFHTNYISPMIYDLWHVTNDSSPLMSDPPYLGANYSTSPAENYFYFQTTVPGNITSVVLNVRAAAEQGAALRILAGKEPSLFRLTQFALVVGGTPETNITADMTSAVAGSQSLYVAFNHGSTALKAVGIDDLTIDISFAPFNNTTTVFLNDSLPGPNRDILRDSRWAAPQGGFKSNDGLQHFGTLETSAYGGYYSFSQILSANMSFSLICDQNTPDPQYIQVYAGDASRLNWTLLAETNSTTNFTYYAGDITPQISEHGFYIRVTAYQKCIMSDYEMAIVVDPDVPNMPRGTYQSEAVDVGHLVDLTAFDYDVTLTPTSGWALWTRSSLNNVSWSAWTRTSPSDPLPNATGRFVQFKVLLWAEAAYGLPSIGNFSVSYQALVSVRASVDGWASSTILTIEYLGGYSAVNWSGNIALPPGETTLSVRAFDTTGSYGEQNITVGWDTIAPSAPGDPVGPPQVVNTSVLTWSWGPSTDVGLGVSGYIISVGTSPGASDVLSSVSIGSNTSFTLSGAQSLKTYYFRVAARDMPGNQGPWSNETTGTLVDLEAPSPAVPTANLDWTNSSSITWNWPAFADSGSGTAGYEVRLGSFPGGTDLVDGTYQTGTEFTFSNVSDGGSYYVQVRGVDLAGNWGSWSLPSQLVRADLSPPSSPGLIVGPVGYQNIQSVDWQWGAASDSVSGVDRYLVEVGPVQGSSADQSVLTTALHLLMNPLTDGADYWVRVRAVDHAGNWGPWISSTQALSIDRTAPSAPGTVTGPPLWINSTVVTWSWGAATDAGSGVVEYWVGVGVAPEDLRLTGSVTVASLTYTYTQLREGSPVYFSVHAVDAVGNVGEWAISAPVNLDLKAPPAPSSITSPASPTNSSAPTWTWPDSVDDGIGQVTYLVSIGMSSTEARAGVPVAVAGPSYTGLSLVSGTTYYIAVWAVDGLGWVSQQSAVSTGVLVDTVAPEKIALQASSSATAAPKVDLSWIAAADSGASGIDRYEVWASSAGEDTVLPVGPSESGYSFAGQDGHDYQVRVRAVDRAGNQGPWSEPVSVLFDRTGPIAPAGFLYALNGHEVTITWEPSQDASSAVSRYQVSVGTSPGASNVVASDVAVGPTYHFTGQGGTTYYVTVVAVDSLGNLGTAGTDADGISIPSDPTPGLGLIGAVGSMVLVGLIVSLRRR